MEVHVDIESSGAREREVAPATKHVELRAPLMMSAQFLVWRGARRLFRIRQRLSELFCQSLNTNLIPSQLTERRMEDGEIQEKVSGSIYHPALEFPSDDDGWTTPSTGYAANSFPDTLYPYNNIVPIGPSQACSSNTSPSSSTQASTTSTPSTIHTLRLLVLSTGILPRAQKLAVLDGHTQIEFGRDPPAPGAQTPRVRLKEMEVSKLHATLFWDDARLEWAVVDMGSKHGTFIRAAGTGVSAEGASADSDPSSTSAKGDPRGQRLSQPRVSSVPRRLRHLDELSLGSTTFVVHIHEDREPCARCSPKGGDEIPLFHDRKGREHEAARKRKREAEAGSGNAVIHEGRDPKKALTMLKRSLLSRHSTPPAQAPAEARASAYVDRSAKRRALHIGVSDVPGVDSRPLTIASPRATSSTPFVPSPPVSAPPTPLPSSNIGHKLLMKQGWQPGTSLGMSEEDGVEGSVALLEPLQAIQRANRTGLGVPDSAAPTPPPTGMSWQDEAKYRRWNNVKSANSGSG